MYRKPVNRFTFDAHSVLLFSALALSGPVMANASTAQRLAQPSAVSQTASASVATRAAAPIALTDTRNVAEH